jgi:hypothetical protein
MSALVALPLFLAIAAEDPSLELRLVSGTEWDTNAQRAVKSDVFLIDTSRREIVGDALLRVELDGKGHLPIADGHGIDLGYVLGAKRFFSEQSEDVLVHELQLTTKHDLSSLFRVEPFGRFRASRMRNSLRDYTRYGAGAEVALEPLAGWSVGAFGLYDRFAFGPEPGLSYVGPVAGGGVAWWPVDRLRLEISGAHAWRDYEGNAWQLIDQGPTLCDGTDGITTCTPLPRNDTELSIGARALYRGNFVLGGEILARFQRSSSDFERIDRYHFSVFGTFGLPLGFVISLQGGLQFNRGLSATQAQYLVEDDENQNSVELELGREIIDGLGAEVRYALYANEFATQEETHFRRQTFYLGLSYRFESAKEAAR